VFVRVGGEQNSRIKVLQTNGVFGFCGSARHGQFHSDEQIDTLQTIVRQKLPFSPHPFSAWPESSNPRGSLDGVVIPLGDHDDRSLVVSVEKHSEVDSHSDCWLSG